MITVFFGGVNGEVVNGEGGNEGGNGGGSVLIKLFILFL